MKKAMFVIRTRNGFERVSGYITDDGKHGIDKRGGKCDAHKQFWYITDIPTGLSFDNQAYKTRKDAIADISRLDGVCEARKLRESKAYGEAVAKMSEFNGVKSESEGKKMTKTNAKAKANTKAKANNNKALEKENKELKKELEILKKQIEELTRVEKTTIDNFDVEGYMASRDNNARITAELVEALENTEGLTVTRKGADGWVYVAGKTADDTRTRKDIFKTMGFRWSGKESAWFLAPYPLASGKRWASKKARANANA